MEEQAADNKPNLANKYLQPYKSKKSIILDNFLGGLAWSVGTFIGLSLLVTVVGYVISQIDLIPIIGNWLAQILQEATNKVQTPIK